MFWLISQTLSRIGVSKVTKYVRSWSRGVLARAGYRHLHSSMTERGTHGFVTVSAHSRAEVKPCSLC